MACLFMQDGNTILKKVTDLNIISDGAEFKDLCGFQSRLVKSLFTAICKGLGLFNGT